MQVRGTQFGVRVKKFVGRARMRHLDDLDAKRLGKLGKPRIEPMWKRMWCRARQRHDGQDVARRDPCRSLHAVIRSIASISSRFRSSSTATS